MHGISKIAAAAIRGAAANVRARSRLRPSAELPDATAALLSPEAFVKTELVIAGASLARRTISSALIPDAAQWPHRKPWLLTNAVQFLPGPPPSLDSEIWARDYNEIKVLGAKNSASRTAVQTDIARFWEARVPTIYFPVVRSVANQPGRDVTRNARLLALAGQAMDDALIAVFDAKYIYNFWRPIIAIRNGDLDGNPATEREASWVPFIDTPMHPEYPCAHCIIAATLGAVLKAEIGDGPTPKLSTSSPTAPGAVRGWSQVDDLVKEVANARIYDGVHYRNSTEVGMAMGEGTGWLLQAWRGEIPAK